MDTRTTLAWNLRRLRVAGGRSVEEFAGVAEVDSTLVGRIERGTANPTLGVLEKLAKTLDVQVVALFECIPAGAKPPKPLVGGRRPSKKK